MTDAPCSPFDELRYIRSIKGKALVRYTKAYNLLQRLCLTEAEGMRSDFTSLFSLLSAVCRKHGIDYHPADRFRRAAGQVMVGNIERSPSAEAHDFAALCRFISDLTGEPVPSDLFNGADVGYDAGPSISNVSAHKKRRDLYATILSVAANDLLRCRLDETGEEVTVHLRHDSASFASGREGTDPLPGLKACSYPDATVMLLDALEEASGANGKTLSCYQVVIEPDYLIDVTSLTATLKPYGRSPLNYLLNLLTPNLPTRYTLLGNLAGRFMDDLIRGKADKRASMLNDFRENVLEYICLPDSEINPDYFLQADKLYGNIAYAIRENFASPEVGMSGQPILIEPSFICPALGLRGRFDAMTADRHKILELKSGRADEHNPAHPRPRTEHILQMTLYGEMMRRNCGMGWDDLQTYLFYARYPRFYDERPSAGAIRDILSLRNGIVYLIHYLSHKGISPLLSHLTTEALNRTGLHTTFYDRYLRPQLDAATRPLALLQHDPLLRSYFDAFLSFTLRESLIGKTFGKRPDSLRGFAATWHADLHRKRLAGTILDGLVPNAVTRDEEGMVSLITFSRPDATAGEAPVAPDFAPGEMVQLYDATEPGADVTNRQLFRATLIDLTHEEVTIALAYSQTDDTPFTHDRRFCIEHDTTDAPMRRNLQGLFSLLTAPAARRDLILGRRPPQADTSLALNAPCDESIAPIILAARQAKDYYLLVGPPGSGKTNFAMKAMVREYLHSIRHQPNAARRRALMLTAYTNRAVDEICSMLEGLCEEETFDYLRIGNPHTCAPAYHHRLLSERAASLKNRAAARMLFDDTPIIVGTVLTLSARQLIFSWKHFRTAIIDEASQLLEPQLLGLLCATTPKGKTAIDKFILIGDHKQLPAVVELPTSQTRTTNQQLREMGLTDLSQAFFQRLHTAERRAGRTAFTGLLSRQGRMHSELGAYVSRTFYNGELTTVPLPHQTGPLPWQNARGPLERFVAAVRMGFVPIKPDHPSDNIQVNEPEAHAVANLIEALCSLSLKAGITDFCPERAIGVIVPFRGQIGMVRNTLRRRGHEWADRLTIDTVECYQGSQRDYIIFSTTVSEPHQLALLSQPQTIEGTPVDRKLNVALTRARLQFFLVGNPDLLAHSPAYADLIRHCTPLHKAGGLRTD